MASQDLGFSVTRFWMTSMIKHWLFFWFLGTGEEINFLLSYSKIAAKSSVVLENCDVLVNYGKNNEITGCDIHSKVVTLEAGTDKANKLASLEIRLSLSPVNGLIPVLPSTRRYLRRMEKAEFFKKNNKKATDILSFIQPVKA